MTLPFRLHLALLALGIMATAAGFYVDATMGLQLYGGQVGLALTVPYALILLFGRVVFPDAFPPWKGRG